jgi:hypothetical protein
MLVLAEDTAEAIMAMDGQVGESVGDGDRFGLRSEWPGVRDKVMRNVVSLCTVPYGLDGRPSKSLTFDQAKALIAAAERSTLHAYIVLSLMSTCAQVRARSSSVRAPVKPSQSAETDPAAADHLADACRTSADIGQLPSGLCRVSGRP